MHKILKNSIIVLLGEKVTMGDCQKKKGGERKLITGVKVYCGGRKGGTLISCQKSAGSEESICFNSF